MQWVYHRQFNTDAVRLIRVALEIIISQNLKKNTTLSLEN